MRDSGTGEAMRARRPHETVKQCEVEGREEQWSSARKRGGRSSEKKRGGRSKQRTCKGEGARGEVVKENDTAYDKRSKRTSGAVE
jgi:hypothetical protein